ncbi:MAG TPA: Gfo/Idh/MocA family oxidoreductase [Verrucomicrobiae bacterium]|jgi:predicted dehydrogenase|nr:Gfo/Idh/MocA family oxidoreductase [Verrucomicrobiae bacterium]
MKKLRFAIAALCALLAITARSQEEKPPVRIAIIGLSHDHAYGFLPRLPERKDVVLVGIVETNTDLIQRYSKRYHLDPGLFFPNAEALLAHTNVQAVAAFGSVFEHRQVVEEFAPHHIDVMMEKPLAVNMKHARAIEAAAKKYGIQVIVNYETTWYPGNAAAYDIVQSHAIGDVRKIVAHYGHNGPKEIGCSTNFLNWLTDPVLNGGGAVVDFGCYGADWITWLMHGEAPTSVFAVTQQIKPDVYPKVDDEATIVLTYPKAQAIIQASWNWPFNRKDIEIYGRTGYVIVPNPDLMHVRKPGEGQEHDVTPPPIAGPDADPLSYLLAVVRGEIKPAGPSSLGVNLIAMEILDAARESARTGKRVELK